jgi:hypothetical protein
MQTLGKPVLALLGGFSHAVVHRILNRLVHAVGTLVSGEAEDVVAAQTQAVKARYAEQATQNRLRLAADLIKLQEVFKAGGVSDELQAKLDAVLKKLMPLDEEGEE